MYISFDQRRSVSVVHYPCQNVELGLVKMLLFFRCPTAQGLKLALLDAKKDARVDPLESRV